jgi:hypothetical protein
MRHRLHRPPAVVRLQAAMAGGVHKARSVPVRHAASPVMGEVVGGDCPLDHAQPPSLPSMGRLRGLISREQVVPAERTTTVLPGQQVQVVIV